MTKRNTILGALAFLFVSAAPFSGGLSAQNRVLFEEFTSSTCPPCAGLEPFMIPALADKHDEITVLRWHQNFPQPGDPSYNMNTPGGARLLSYYSDPSTGAGIPAFVMNGGTLYNPASFASGPIEDSIDADLAAMPNYYKMSVTQSILGDSIIALITVTTGATVPSATDLRLCTVVAQRFSQYEGYNGVSAHEYIARQAIPPLASNGSFPASAAFSQAANTTQTYRVGTTIKPTWDATQLIMVAFIQSAAAAGTTAPKPVYQSAWSENLNIDIEPVNTTGFFADGTATDDFTVTNNSDSTVKVYLSAVPSTTIAPITLGIKGMNVLADNNGSYVTLAPMQSDVVSITGVDASSKYTGWGLFGIQARTADSIGIGGTPGIVIGNNVTTLVLDAGAQNEGSTSTQGCAPLVQKSLTNIGIPSAYCMGGEFSPDYANGFNNDWSHFKNVVFAGGDYYPGFYPGDGNLANANSFLQSGGHLVLESGFFAYYYEETGDDASVEGICDCDTLANSNGLNGSNTWSKVAGTSSPIGKGISATLTKQNYSAALQSYDNNCQGIFTDPNGDTVGVAASTQGGKCAYLTFDIGQVAVSQRDTVTKRIFEWFDGTLGSLGVEKEAPLEITSLTASPNPFTSETKINYLAKTNETNVQMSVVDVLGREVAVVVPVRSGENTYTSTLGSVNLASGTYRVVVHSSTGVHTLPVVITR